MVNRTKGQRGVTFVYSDRADWTVFALDDNNKQPFKQQNKLQVSQPSFFALPRGQTARWDFPLLVVLKAENSKFFFSPRFFLHVPEHDHCSGTSAV